VRDGRRDVDDDVDDDDDDGDEDEDVDVETRRTRGARRRGEAKMRMRLESSVIHDDESKRSDPRSRRRARDRSTVGTDGCVCFGSCSLA